MARPSQICCGFELYWIKGEGGLPKGGGYNNNNPERVIKIS